MWSVFNHGRAFPIEILPPRPEKHFSVAIQFFGDYGSCGGASSRSIKRVTFCCLQLNSCIVVKLLLRLRHSGLFVRDSYVFSLLLAQCFCLEELVGQLFTRNSLLNFFLLYVVDVFHCRLTWQWECICPGCRAQEIIQTLPLLLVMGCNLEKIGDRLLLIGASNLTTDGKAELSQIVSRIFHCCEYHNWVLCRWRTFVCLRLVVIKRLSLCTSLVLIGWFLT